MQDCYYKRETGIGDFERRDSGNIHLNKPRTGMSVDENLPEEIDLLSLWKAPGEQAAAGLFMRGNVNYIRSEAANLSKILNGPKGNEASKTAASVEMLNGLEKPPASLRIISIWRT